MRKAAGIVLLFLLCDSLKAQQEYTLHFTRALIQASHTNPAIRNRDHFTLALPSFAFNFGNNAFSLNDLIKDSPDYDSTYLDMDGVIAKMSENNILQFQSELDVLGAAMRYKDWSFSFFITEKFDFRFSYPRDLVDLLWNGNAKFIGQTIEIGPGVYFNYMKELSIGAARTYKNWDFGTRLKFLSGITNINSVKDKLTLHTSEDNYATTLSTDYEVRTAGTPNLSEYILRPPKNFENPGMAVDLGAVYRHGEKWEFAQSFLDLGAIKWKRDVARYRSNGTFTYSGVDLAEFIEDKDVQFESFSDSIKKLYFSEEKGGSYWSGLVPESYSSALFKADKKTNLGGLVHLSYFSGVQFGMSVYAGRELMRYLDLGLSYSIKNKRFDNFGLNLGLGPKGFRFFVVTDNLFNFLQSRAGRNVTWRYGINIGIGKREKKDKKKESEDREDLIQPAGEDS